MSHLTTDQLIDQSGAYLCNKHLTSCALSKNVFKGEEWFTKAMAKSKSKTGKGKLNCFNIIHKSIIIILDCVLTGDILIYKV